jgi:hypothetical protein
MFFKEGNGKISAAALARIEMKGNISGFFKNLNDYQL